MVHTDPGTGAEPVGFLLVPQFSMMAFSSAVEPLRVANRLAARPLFSWHAYSLDGAPVPASNGIAIPVEAAVSDVRAIPTLILCAGFEPRRYEDKALLASLRRLARGGTRLGALDTGPHILAAAGLLDEARVTMHWEAVSAFREEYPHIDVSDELFETDGRCFTCAGGTAAIDMMLDMIGRKHGAALAVAVSEQFIHHRIRDRRDHQRMALASRLGVANAKLLKIVDLMERNIERPIANEDLAAAGDVSMRQLERLFRQHLSTTPSSYYLALRLKRARELLRQTDLSVVEIAMASGFSSASCLSRSYRAHFGLAPRQDRRERLSVPAPDSRSGAAEGAVGISAAG